MDEIHILDLDEINEQVFSVMQNLRPHIDSMHNFKQQLKTMYKYGFRIAHITTNKETACVAGFRINHNLAWGKFLYIDDLVTAPNRRSQDYGKKLLTFLENYARDKKCNSMHLDSGVQRHQAHRFYFRENMQIHSHHFSKAL